MLQVEFRAFKCLSSCKENDCLTYSMFYIIDDTEIDKETEDSLLKEDDKEALMEAEEYKVL